VTDNQQHLLFFGEDWGRHPSTAQYLALELLDDYSITWVNSIGLREPSLSRADLDRVLGKIKRSTAASTSEAASSNEPDVIRTPQHLLSPWIVPFHRIALVQRLNAALFRNQLNKYAHLQNAPYTVLTANPASYYLLDELSPQKSLYYCADKLAATSKPLVDDLAQHHNNVHYLPHGVDFARFNSTLAATAERTSAANPASQTVGFIGLLGEHIDFELIAASARALPEQQFLYVGPVEEGVTLPQAPNIEYVGAVPQKELPGYIARMDVCTLPYAQSARNHYANPTKVREYLAAGRAVVATRQPGLQDIAGEVSVVDDTDGYINALQSRLSDLAALPATQLAEQRTAIAAPMQNETWAVRAQALRSLI